MEPRIEFHKNSVQVAKNAPGLPFAARAKTRPELHEDCGVFATDRSLIRRMIMTMPGDTNRPTRHPMSMNRDGEGWGIWPVVLGVLAVVLVLYFLLGPRDRATTGVAQRSDAPQTRMTTPSNPTTPEPNAPTTK